MNSIDKLYSSLLCHPTPVLLPLLSRMRYKQSGAPPTDPEISFTSGPKRIVFSIARAGLDYVSMLSSHSLRRGMATSAYRAGASPRDIKRQGGWRDDGTVHGYIDEAGQIEENAAVALLRRKRKV